MPEFVTVAPVEDMPPGASRCVATGDKELALFHVGGSFYAIDNECSHYGAPLCDGWTDGATVTCPWHCWQFDLKSGKCLTEDDYDVGAYEVRVEDGKIQVLI